MPTVECGSDPTFWDKASFLPVFLRILSTSSIAFLRGPFRGENGAPNMTVHVGFQAIRTLNTYGSIKQRQWLIGDTEKVYQEVCKSKCITPESTSLSNGAKIHWFGSKSAKRVFLYFHGGGYALPASGDHVKWAYSLQKNLEKSGHDFAVALLGYTLSTVAGYPTQLKEGVEALRLLIETEGHNPGDIMVGGDSAGANLTCMILSHALHPHPDVPELKLREPLRALIITSPWVSFREDGASFKTNQYNDCINATISRTFHQAWVKMKDWDNYNHPIQAPLSWWSGSENVAKDIFIWIGGHEVLLNGAQEWAQQFKKEAPSTEILVTAKDGHDAFVLEPLLGQKPGEGAIAIEAWMGARL